MQKQGVEVVDLVQKTLVNSRSPTTALLVRHSSELDLRLVARGIQQANPWQNTHTYLGTVPRLSAGTVPGKLTHDASHVLDFSQGQHPLQTMFGTSEHRLVHRRFWNRTNPFGWPFDVVGDRTVAMHSAVVGVQFEDLTLDEGFLFAFLIRDLVGHNDHQLADFQVLDLASNGHDLADGFVPQGRRPRRVRGWNEPARGIPRTGPTKKTCSS